MQPQSERVLLVGVDFHAADFENALEEAKDLISAVEGDLVEVLTCKRASPHAALFVGTGKAQEIAALVQAQQIDLVVFNHELTPTQERNLEQAMQCRVLDRVGLILAIFAMRAQSQEGKLQVELAQLTHLSSRLVRGYKHLKSQRGGIGLKGPGETQLETDRRLIVNKIARLKARLKDVKKQRATQRKGRGKSGLKTFALVGYTNAGKSSLFNRLTKSEVFAADQLFATLDPTARRLYLSPEASVIITDTVGFVRDLPHSLVAAFSATLEETAMADVLLHVVDVSNEDYERQMADVDEVLVEIGAADVPQLVVYNKMDLVPEDARLPIGQVRGQEDELLGVRVSIQSGEGLDELRAAMIELANA